VSGCADRQRGLSSRRLLSQVSPPQAAPLRGIEGVGETVEAVGKFEDSNCVCREGVREASQVVGPNS
jgi:hypothetical protein